MVDALLDTSFISGYTDEVRASVFTIQLSLLISTSSMQSKPGLPSIGLVRSSTLIQLNAPNLRG